MVDDTIPSVLRTSTNVARGLPLNFTGGCSRYSGITSLVISFTNVDLPAPFGPKKRDVLPFSKQELINVQDCTSQLAYDLGIVELEQRLHFGVFFAHTPIPSQTKKGTR